MTNIEPEIEGENGEIEVHTFTGTRVSHNFATSDILLDQDRYLDFVEKRFGFENCNT